jgi:hypothetical protein
VEEYRTARNEVKIYTNKRKIYLLNVGLRNWKVSEVSMKANPSIRKLNKSRKDIQPRKILCRDKEGMLLREEDGILKR